MLSICSYRLTNVITVCCSNGYAVMHFEHNLTMLPQILYQCIPPLGTTSIVGIYGWVVVWMIIIIVIQHIANVIIWQNAQVVKYTCSHNELANVLTVKAIHAPQSAESAFQYSNCSFNNYTAARYFAVVISLLCREVTIVAERCKQGSRQWICCISWKIRFCDQCILYVRCQECMGYLLS